MRKIVLVAALACVCASFVSCGNKKSTEVVTIDNGRMLTKTDSEVKEISGSDYVSKKVRKENYYNNNAIVLKDRVITSSEKGGLDVIYDNGKTDYIEPQTEGFYIVNYISNGNFIVWVESNTKTVIKGEENLTHEYIYSRNIETGEFQKVAEFDYTRLEEYEAGVRALDISENNNLVYKYYKETGSGTVKEKAVLYNLDGNFQKEVITNTDENVQIDNLSVGLGNVIYTKTRYDENSKEIIQQEVMNYEIGDSSTEPIDLGIDVKNLDIYDRDIVFISESENQILELYIYNIDTSQLISRVFEDSNLSKYYEKMDIKLAYNEEDLHIDDSYIYMLGQSSVVYDLKQKKFIVLESEMLLNNYDYMYSHKVGDKKVVISCTKGSEKIITEYTLN
ncbi:MAG: hypothetical protein ACRCWM_00100 [Sarcina sp.]